MIGRRLTGILDGMLAACNTYNEDTVRGLLGEMVPEWSGYSVEDYKMVPVQAEDAVESAEKPNILH